MGTGEDSASRQTEWLSVAELLGLHLFRLYDFMAGLVLLRLVSVACIDLKVWWGSS
jgi:hypothetical protein